MTDNSIDKPEIYLFLSVDIINSTLLKYNPKNGSENDNWYSLFTSFYKELPTTFSSFIQNSFKTFGLKECPKLQIWKYAGDEILFYVNIRLKNEIPAVICSFERTLQEWYDPENNKDVHIKGCAWTGQFPFIDRKIIFSEELDKSGANKRIDFIGPSIDCGFRLGKYANRNKIVLSVEVVDICRQCSFQSLNFYYIKSENLKGVLGSLEYPIFVMLVGNANKTLEEKHLLSNCQQSNLENFITDYYRNFPDKYKNKVSRIGFDIESYLASKEEISKQIIKKSSLSESQEHQQEAGDGTGENSSDFKNLENLIYKSSDSLKA